MKAKQYIQQKRQYITPSIRIVQIELEGVMQDVVSGTEHSPDIPSGDGGGGGNEEIPETLT